MPYLVGILLAWVVQLGVGLGVGLLSYTVALPSLMNFLSVRMNLIPDATVATLGYFNVDIFISLVLSGAAAGLSSRISFVKK